jgi:hypothetical protein
VESFLRQDYPNRELLILNDCPKQTLYIQNAPDVRIINLPERLLSLGDKFNFLAGMAEGELLMVWNDDDLSLPWRTKQCVTTIGATPYWNPQRTWYMDKEGLHYKHSHGVCHNAGIYRKDAWQKVEGYPSVSGPQDAIFDSKLKQLGMPPQMLGANPSYWSYIYRWGVSDVHLTGFANSEEAYKLHGQKPHMPGKFEIVPVWKQDYVALCAEKAKQWEKENL